jgi:hypothetical protein
VPLGVWYLPACVLLPVDIRDGGNMLAAQWRNVLAENYVKMCEQAQQAAPAAPVAAGGYGGGYPAAGGYGGGGGGGGGGGMGGERDASGREICRDYIRGRCGRSNCRFSHGEHPVWFLLPDAH